MIDKSAKKAKRKLSLLELMAIITFLLCTGLYIKVLEIGQQVAQVAK